MLCVFVSSRSHAFSDKHEAESLEGRQYFHFRIDTDLQKCRTAEPHPTSFRLPYGWVVIGNELCKQSYAIVQPVPKVVILVNKVGNNSQRTMKGVNECDDSITGLGKSGVCNLKQL